MFEMEDTDIQLPNNNEALELVEETTFPIAIDEALQNCARARDFLLTMKSELEDDPACASSPAHSYCNINLHVNDALQSSIRSIGHGGGLVNRLRRMLTSEQRNEVAGDLHNMQRELVNTYASCQAADRELWFNLRQTFHEDPVLRDDPFAVQCVDAIDEQTNQLQALSSTSESLLERSLMMSSIQSNLNLLEERTEQISPNGPLSKVLKLFQRALASMIHTLHSVIKTLRYEFSF